jgi:hypothetical protein
LDFQLQLDAWFDSRANVRHHRTLRCRPIDRLIEERAVMAPLAMTPDTDRRWVLRVPPDPYLRFDTCDYALGAARRDAAILRFGLLERPGRRWRHLPARSRARSPMGVLAVTWAALPLFGRVDQSRRPAGADIIVEPIIVVQPADASM